MRRRHLVLAAFLLGLLMGCSTTPTTPSTAWRVAPSPASDQGMALAVQCAARHALPVLRPYGQLRLWLDSVTQLGGYALGYDVVVAARLADNPRAWGHELLHQVYGLPGLTPFDHPPLFRECDLWL